MKKLYGACSALLLGLLLAFAGCSGSRTSVLDYLKDNQFVGNPSGYETTYKVELNVSSYLSYSLKIAYGSDELKNYSVSGQKMEYLGYEEQFYNSEWLGVTQKNTYYSHVVRLNGATVEMNGKEYTFYIVAHSTAKRESSYGLSLKAYANGGNTDEDRSNLSSIIKGSPSFTLKRKSNG